MIWNVYIENFNTKKIEVYNIFDHASFKHNILQEYSICKSKEVFFDKLKRELTYYFWCKCEWEMVITDWPTHITVDEIEDLNDELSRYESRWHRKPYSLNVDLPIQKKISVYDQVMLNWDIFAEYVWNELSQ